MLFDYSWGLDWWVPGHVHAPVGLHTAPLGLLSAPRSPTDSAGAARYMYPVDVNHHRAVLLVSWWRSGYVLAGGGLRTSVPPFNCRSSQRRYLKARWWESNCTRHFTSPSCIMFSFLHFFQPTGVPANRNSSEIRERLRLRLKRKVIFLHELLYRQKSKIC
jgi:hypothetical protein